MKIAILFAAVLFGSFLNLDSFETTASTNELSLDTIETNFVSLNGLAYKIYATLTDFQNYLQIKSASILDLDKLKIIYKYLESCVRDSKTDIQMCMDGTIVLKNLKSRLIEISAKNSKEINTYDRNENTCLRHFITGNVFPDFRQTFDLEKCLRNGFKETISQGNQDENLIYGFWNLRIALWSCRVDLNKTNIEKCITETLVSSNEARSISRTIQSISDDELKNPNNKVYESYNNENDCIGYIFEKLKFRGLFMDDLTKNEFKRCVDKRYVSNPDKVFTKDATNKFETIANSLDKCTEYPVGQEFSKCVSESIDASKSSLDYIQKSFNNFIAEFSSCNKCLEEIVSRKDKLCSSSKDALCSYPDIESCLSNRKQNIYGTPLRYSNYTIGTMTAGVTLTVTGYIVPSLLGFSINLNIDPYNNALHFNPRFWQKSLVVNTYENGNWAGKELAYPILPTYNLNRGSKFSMRISITDSVYIISINGIHLTNFKHRLPYKSVSYVSVYGDIDYISLNRS